MSNNIPGLPSESDPYAGSTRSDIKGQDAGMEAPPAPSPDMGGSSISAMGMAAGGIPGPTPGPTPGPPMPTKPTWGSFSLPENKAEMAFQRSDGFYLRARPFKSVPTKWMAQIFTQTEEVQTGHIFIPEGVDPGRYLQRISDYILDDESYRYQQSGADQQQQQPIPQIEEMPEPPAQDLGQLGGDINVELT